MRESMDIKYFRFIGILQDYGSPNKNNDIFIRPTSEDATQTDRVGELRDDDRVVADDNEVIRHWFNRLDLLAMLQKYFICSPFVKTR